MITLDYDFLAEVGLEGVPRAAADKFLHQIYKFLHQIYYELELRVGTRLSDGLTDIELNEFERIINRDEQLVVEWIDANATDYATDPIFKRMHGALGTEVPLSQVLIEYTATKWLELHKPNYRDIVAAMLDDLKVELRERAEVIREVLEDENDLDYCASDAQLL
ncbi:DUF5663 domain-containing protein [Antrihabitans spumae]|uniref:DUF5663 domain-containing protein n=1 Tax=Antrihabitans spumae TaxID=3373370 RepID=A0ABW7K767_9NOCA